MKKQNLTVLLLAVLIILSSASALAHSELSEADQSYEDDGLLYRIRDLFGRLTGFVVATDAGEIETIEDLYNIRDDMKSDYYLSNDLDFCDEDSYEDPDNIEDFCADYGGDGWNPIGTHDKGFEGNFYGFHNEIKNLYIDRGGENYIGLFGYVGRGGTVSDTALTDVEVKGGYNVGGLAGHAEEKSLSSIFVDGYVEGYYHVGGVVGFLGSGSELHLSYQDAVVEVHDNRAGGLVGFVGSSSRVKNSYSTGKVEGSSPRIGGLVGYIGDSTGALRKSYSMAEVGSGGGLVGENKGLVSRSFNAREETGQDDAVGVNSGDLIETHSLDNEDMRTYGTYNDLDWSIERFIYEDDDQNDGFPFIVSHGTAWVIYDPDFVLEVQGHSHGQVVEPGVGIFEVEAEDTVDLLAEPYEGYYFDSWEGDTETVEDRSSEDTSIDILDDYTIGPEFSRYRELSVESGEGGKVDEPGEGRFEYKKEDVVVLKAKPEERYNFYSWSGDVVSEDKEVTVEMTEDKEVYAEFVEAEYFKVEITEPQMPPKHDEGDIIGVEYFVENTGSLEDTQDVEFVVLNDTDHVVHREVEEDVSLGVGDNYTEGFFQWAVDSHDEAPYKLMVSSNDDSDSVYINVYDYFTLSIGSHGDGWTSPEEGNYTYKEETGVRAEAVPGDEGEFDRWVGDYPDGGRNSPEIDLTMDRDRQITALFETVTEDIEYNLSISVDGNGTTDPEPGTYTYEENDEVVVEAIANESWEFDRWDGDVEDNGTEIEVIMYDDKEIEAVFREEEDGYEIDLTIQGDGTVEIEPDKEEYEEGEEVSLNATPDSGWHFDYWEGDVQGEDPEINLTVDNDTVVFAFFSKIGYHELSLDVFGDGTVEIDPEEEEYEYGETVSLEAEPDPGWVFDRWEGDHEGSEESLEVSMEEDIQLEAYFEEIPSPELRFDDSVEVELGEGEQQEVSVEIENDGDEDANLELSVEEVEDFVGLGDYEMEIASGATGSIDLEIEIPEGTDAGSYQGSLVMWIEEIDTEKEIDLDIVVLDLSEVIDEDALSVDVDLVLFEFEQGEPVTYNLQVENAEDRVVEVDLEVVVYDREGRIADEHVDYFELDGFQRLSDEFYELDSGEYLIEATIEPQDDLFNAVSDSEDFVVVSTGLINIWYLSLVLVVVAASAVAYLSIKNDWWSKFTGEGSGE